LKETERDFVEEKIIDFRARPNVEALHDFFESAWAKLAMKKLGYHVAPVESRVHAGC